MANSSKQGSRAPPVKCVSYEGLSDESFSPRNSTFSGKSSEVERSQPQGSAKQRPNSPPKVTMPSRKYCCSNSPQAESKIWAICDTVCAFLVFVIVVYFLYILKSDKQFLYDVVQSEPNQQDLKKFLEYSDLKQDIYVVVAIMREICSVILGVLLYLAAKMRCQQQLRIWLGCTFVAIVIDLILFIPKMTFTQNKFLYVSLMIAYFLYKWYEVWMVTLLFKEVREEGIVQPNGPGHTNSSFQIEPEAAKGEDQLVQAFQSGKSYQGSEISSIKLRDDNEDKITTLPSNFRQFGGYYGSNMGSFVLTEPPKKLQYRGNVPAVPESKHIFGADDVETFRY